MWRWLRQSGLIPVASCLASAGESWQSLDTFGYWGRDRAWPAVRRTAHFPCNPYGEAMQEVLCGFGEALLLIDDFFTLACS